MLKRYVPVAVLALIFAMTAPSAAETPANVTLDGYYRVRGFYLTHPDLEPDTRPNVERYFQHRLRLLPHFFINEAVSLHVMADAVDDQIWGANTGNILSQSTADEKPNFLVKRVWAEVETSFGQFKVGRQGSQWGKGLYSNDGLGFRNEWGDAHYGDTYDRILFTTKPLGVESPLTAAIFYDKVVEISGVEDPGAIAAARGDIDQLGLSVEYAQEEWSAGLYGIYRFQSHTDTRVWIPDVYLSWDNGVFHADFEVVGILGETQAVPALLKRGDKYRNDAGKTVTVDEQYLLAQPKLNLEAFGASTEVGMRFGKKVDLAVELGAATGDKPGSEAFADGKLSEFSFDPDYNVGLLMFEEAYRLYTDNRAQEIKRSLAASNPALGGTSIADYCAATAGCNATPYSNGVRAFADYVETTVGSYTPTRGSVRNAFYIQPKVRFQPTGSVKLQAAILWARALADVETREFSQAGNEFSARKTARNYGFEVDLGVSYSYTDNLVIGLQAGWFKPGDVFVRANGAGAPSMFLVQPRFTVVF